MILPSQHCAIMPVVSAQLSLGACVQWYYQRSGSFISIPDSITDIITLIPPKPRPEIERPRSRSGTPVEAPDSREPKVYRTLDIKRISFLPMTSESLAQMGVDAVEKRRLVVAIWRPSDTLSYSSETIGPIAAIAVTK